MNITYEQFLVLSCANAWLDLGLPFDDLVNFTVGSTEGDPRGDISKDQAKISLNEAFEKGWVEYRPASDNTNCMFVYPTIEGKKVCLENLDYWYKQLKDKS